MKKAVWLVPDLIEGSGGHRTILQHADFMQQSGWEVVLYLEAATESFRESPSALIERLFGYSFPDVRVGWETFVAADAYFATIWYSAKVVRDIPIKSEKFYFVQDYEALFNPMGDSYLQAENSYRYGLKVITIGNWLSNKLESSFNCQASAFDFCADLEVYRPLNKVERESNSICFVYQPEKPRRCTVIGLEALAIVKHYIPEVKIYLFGSSAKSDLPFDHENLGLLNLEKCNELYNRCSVGLCISSSNPSRVPFEMMAAGLPVVELWRENNLYDFESDTAVLADPTPESLAKGIIQLISNPERRHEISNACQIYMAGRNIEFGLRQFLEIVERAIAGDCEPRFRRGISYGGAPVVDDHFKFSISQGKSPKILNWKGRLVERLPSPLQWLARKTYRHLKGALAS
ncbi:hypothetical protein [Microbulbifer elongatus]|uniref:rhamnosyltransferase WsaF family glycosyltransferase n=1 Tax=Microbulbifer elongatus TaxID=86173 RepID=UPI001CFE37F0|nr:hypothetical protein [Microbulbifer elongatus]